ncbi:MAG: Hpt domain-containing protein [Betaproteobacteria bacterium]|nr:MAG: Hpt domain-containing protein [Betaproteobacteria bacterium]
MQNDVTLSMIADEVKRSLAEAKTMLQSEGAADDANTLERARSVIEQVRGALRVAEVAGATRVLLEIEQLLGEAIDAEEVTLADSRLAEIRTISARGLESVQDYVHGLVDGMAPDPLAFAEIMGELLGARGSDRLAELELFETNLTRSVPDGVRAPESADSLDFSPGSLRELRARFQKALLDWLRGDTDSLSAMRDIVGQIHAEAPDPVPWWIARAFMEHLDSGNIPTSVHVKRVFARMDKYLARLCADQIEPPEALLREMLYFLAQGVAGSALVGEVREHYELEASQPESTTVPPVNEKEIKSLVQGLPDLWEAAAADGGPASVQAFTTRVREIARELPDELVPLLETVRAAADAKSASEASRVGTERTDSNRTDRKRTDIDLEVAMALIVVADALSDTDDPDRTPRLDAMNSRLQSLLQQGDAASLNTPELPWKSRERALLRAFGGELVSLFNIAEQKLSEYFADPDATDAIDAVKHALEQARGALQVTGDHNAVSAVQYCIDQTNSLAGSTLEDQQRARGDLAAVISALSFYADRLEQDEADLAEILQKAGAPDNVISAQPAENAITAEPPAPARDDQAETVESSEESRIDESAKPDQPVSLQEQEGDSKSEASIVTASSDKPIAHAELSAGTAHDADSEHRIATLPSAENGDVEGVDVPTDLELLSVFVDEANAVLWEIGETLERLRANWPDAQALFTLRRGFHTLKGSGRMVGLSRFAEAAYVLEKLLDASVQAEVSNSEELLLLLDTALIRIRSWVGALASDKRVRIESGELTQWAERVGHGTVSRDPAQRESTGQESVQSKTMGRAVDETPSVVVGDVRLSRTLFDVFVGEAGRATNALVDEFVTPVASVDKAKAHERFGLAHTLRGIAGTAGFPELRGLAGALEIVLRGADEHGVQLSAVELDVCASVATALREMLDSIRALKAPTARPDLEAQLREIAQQQQSGMAGIQLELVDAPSRDGDGQAEPIGFDPFGDTGALNTGKLDSLVNTGILNSFGDTGVLDTGVVDTGVLDSLGDIGVLDAGVLNSVADTGLLDVQAGVFGERRSQQRMRDDIDPTLLPHFLEEAAELVPQISEALRSWRADPQQPGSHEALTRLLHTFKGGARMAGAMALGELTHSMEARVVTAAELPIVPGTLFDALEVSFDRMGVLLERLSKPESAAAEAEALPAQPSLRVRVDLLERLATEAGELVTSRSSVEGQVRAIRGQMREMGSTVEQLRLKLRELEMQAETQIQSRQVRADESEGSLDPLELDRFTRLQELTRLIEENANDVTSITQTIVRQIDGCDGALAAQERMTRVLQDSLVNVRMVPFSTLNERLYRVVRLTARDAGRRASLDIRGSGANLDRGVVDRIAAPLEHLLRNAVVHGIETPEERAAAGKPEAGEIVVDVSQEGNEVVLVLQDDGRGLDLERLRTRAVEAGRVAADAPLSPEQLAQLAFEPGVSTASEVSASAGRGVGLDVVRNEVAAVGGRIDVAFEPQQGTVFTVRLPLSMTVMQVLVMRCGGQFFAVPAMMVEQVRTLKPQALETVCQAGLVDWQSHRYPLHNLRELLGFAEASHEAQAFTPVVLLRGGAQRIAIRIDELVTHEEVVIKEIGSQLVSVSGMLGAAVRGGGEIVLILNPIRLAQEEPVPMPLRRRESVATVDKAPAIATVLVVDDSLTVRKITNRVLSRNGYRVLEARDGVEALESLENDRPQIVLLDAEMPRMDGFEVLRRMRSDPNWRELPVMMITSRTAEKHRNHAMQLGASAFLGKPFEEQQLLARVAELIEQAAA